MTAAAPSPAGSSPLGAGPLSLGAACPGCGARIALSSLEPSVRCEHCQTSHLVSWRGPVSTIVLRDRLAAPGQAEAAAREETGSDLPWNRTPFLAPTWLTAFRLHEAVVGHGPDGGLVAEAWSAPLHLARTAAPGELPLPPSNRLPELLDGDFLPAGEAGQAPLLPLSGGPAEIDEELPRIAATRLAPRVEPLVRSALLSRGPVHLLLRPFYLLEPADGRGDSLLVDGAAGSVSGSLHGTSARHLRAAVETRPLPVPGGLAFRPMRCSVCASRLALAERGEIRFCPGCRRALEVAGERLLPVAYRAEVRSGPRRLLLPFWRFPFSLSDPRDGRELSSVAALVEAAGGEAVPPGEAFPFLDVPAYRAEGRRRQRPGLSRLVPAAEPPAPQLAEGPVRGEAGFPEPSRWASVSSKDAALVARHVLLLSLPATVVGTAAPRRLAELCFDAPLRLGPPSLVLRSLRPDALAP
jgi:hypothetical protein